MTNQSSEEGPLKDSNNQHQKKEDFIQEHDHYKQTQHSRESSSLSDDNSFTSVSSTRSNGFDDCNSSFSSLLYVSSSDESSSFSSSTFSSSTFSSHDEIISFASDSENEPGYDSNEIDSNAIKMQNAS